MPKKPTMPKLPKSVKLPKSIKLPKSLSALKLSRFSKLAKTPKLSVLRKISSLPFLAKIPLRTKLIFAGCMLVVCISVPVMLVLASSGTSSSEGEEIVTGQEASKSEEEKSEPTKSGSKNKKAKSTESPETKSTKPVETEQPTPTPEPASTEKAISVGTPIKSPEQIPQITMPSETRIKGAIVEDSTWVFAGSPYILTDVVRVKSGVTLNIEPGVTITKPSKGDMFIIEGSLIAHGTVDNPIVFSGGGNSSFFTSPDFAIEVEIDLQYCRIENGISLRPRTQLGSFNLRHSTIQDLSEPAYIWFPEEDVQIEGNLVTRAAGFSILTNQDVTVYFGNNLFEGKSPYLSDDADYWIQNRGSFNQSETIVEFNSFTPNDGIALQLICDKSESSVIAVKNYWGTEYENLINGMIYDKTDNVNCSDFVNFVPILLEPHPDTPG